MPGRNGINAPPHDTGRPARQSAPRPLHGAGRRVLRAAPLLFCLLACLPVHARQNAAADVQAIEQVVEAFRLSLLNKDKPSYMRLFFSDRPEDIGWQFVSEDVRLQDIRRIKPDAIKARKMPSQNFIGLIDQAVASPEPMEEQFANMKIETDGDVASVSFDYSFHADGVKTNWRKEMWQLVRTEQGWKIFSVVYSIRDSRSPVQ
ncbi:nuclear transport factor 2 family protein [Stenotrophomonas maltophilia]|uniref:nuclear transport factor 2 family protein n=1 Tax=Stenotrophomonas maltophilia TaxID=40324 RepID=UPI000A6E9FD6